MIVISMSMIGILILFNFSGFVSIFRQKKQYKPDEQTEKQYRTIGNSVICLEFLLYFFPLIITCFVVTDKLAILMIVVIILAEIAELFNRFSKIGSSSNYDEMRVKMRKETRSFVYIFVEASELLMFVYLFALLFQQL